MFDYPSNFSYSLIKMKEIKQKNKKKIICFLEKVPCATTKQLSLSLNLSCQETSALLHELTAEKRVILKREEKIIFYSLP